MNCIIYFYKDDPLRKKYDIDMYNKLIATRNAKIWNLCKIYFERVYKYDKSKKLKLSITEPVNTSTNLSDEHSSQLHDIKLMHQITLILFCGNCREMSDDFNTARNLHHYTHYYMYTNSEKYHQLNDTLSNLATNYEESALRKVSVVVFDLDDTLVDESFNPLSEKLTRQLLEFKRIFDCVVLWSHGTSTHVHDALNTVKVPNDLFDLVITRPVLHSCGNNKGLGFVFSELYKRQQVCEIMFSCLVDDTASNYSDDYMLFVHIPRKSILPNLTEYYDWVLSKIRKIKYRYETSGNLKFRTLTW